MAAIKTTDLCSTSRSKDIVKLFEIFVTCRIYYSLYYNSRLCGHNSLLGPRESNEQLLEVVYRRILSDHLRDLQPQ